MNYKHILQTHFKERCDWNFIPAYTSHFGGIWEAGVKSTKHHLKRMMGDASLTFEDLYSLLTQIEAILNSRLLTPLSSHPSDMSPLTPAHFLIGRPLTSVPNPEVTHIPQSRLSRFQHLQQLQQHFCWLRWSKEYLSELQCRTKWKVKHPELREGTLVLIREDHSPPMRWPIGRVTQLHPGSDSISRIVSIQTAKGIIRRAVNRICPLPIDTPVDSKNIIQDGSKMSTSIKTL